MKISAIVLRNIKNTAESVAYGGVLNAFLSGGVYFEEVALLPYDEPVRITATLQRTYAEYDATVLICDGTLLPFAREQLSSFGTVGGDDMIEGDKLFILLPADGRGEELAKTLALNAIDKRRKKRYSRMVFRTVGAPPEKIRQVIAAAREISGEKLSYNISEKYGDARIEAVYDSETPKMLADEVMRTLASGLSEHLYAVDDTPLAERVVEALKLHRLHLSTAESFTGGGVGRAIVSVSGASAVFYEGLNTYANGSKEERLGVSTYTLKSHGAVSDEVAYEMAAGLVQQGHCDVSVATTGIAGPKSDDTQKPVGLCYIAVGTKERVRVYRFHLEGNREKITQTAVNLALFYTYQEIKQ